MSGGEERRRTSTDLDDGLKKGGRHISTYISGLQTPPDTVFDQPHRPVHRAFPTGATRRASDKKHEGHNRRTLWPYPSLARFALTNRT